MNIFREHLYEEEKTKRYFWDIWFSFDDIGCIIGNSSSEWGSYGVGLSSVSMFSWCEKLGDFGYLTVCIFSSFRTAISHSSTALENVSLNRKKMLTSDNRAFESIPRVCRSCANRNAHHCIYLKISSCFPNCHTHRL